MAEKKDAAAPEAHYQILHSAVGAFWQGQTVTAADLGAPGEALSDEQIQRLLDLEAIAPAGSRKAEDARAAREPDARTPAGDSVDDAEAVARQVSHARAAVHKPPKDA